MIIHRQTASLLQMGSTIVFCSTPSLRKQREMSAEAFLSQTRRKYCVTEQSCVWDKVGPSKSVNPASLSVQQNNLLLCNCKCVSCKVNTLCLVLVFDSQNSMFSKALVFVALLMHTLLTLYVTNCHAPSEDSLCQLQLLKVLAGVQLWIYATNTKKF